MATSRPVGFPMPTGGLLLGPPTPMEDDVKMPGFDDLGMAPDIVIDLQAEFVDTSVDPTSSEREFYTDFPPPPAMAVLGWMWLWKRSPCCCRRSLRHNHWLWRHQCRASPELWMSLNQETLMGPLAPLWPVPADPAENCLPG